MPTSILPARIVSPRGRLFALALGLAAFSMAAPPLEAQAQPKPVQSDHKESGPDLLPKPPKPKHTTKRTPKHKFTSEEEAHKYMKEKEAAKDPEPKKAVLPHKPPPHVTPPHPPAAHPGVPK